MNMKIRNILRTAAIAIAMTTSPWPIFAGSWECEQDRAVHDWPRHYCDCAETATDFNFGMVQTINDTTWYKASIEQLKAGLSAYWFSDCNVQIEAYAACTSYAPSLSMTVGKNQMREMDVATINQKLDEMKELAQALQGFKVKIRVYPIGGGSGTVMVYPYDKGPKTDCENAVNMVNGMTLVSNHESDVYEIKPENIYKNRPVYIQWKQKKNVPAHFIITRATCTGDTLAQFTLADSTKLYFPGIQMINQAKEAKQSLFVHVRHDADIVGRTIMRSNFKIINYDTDTVICEGKGLQLVDTILTESTHYSQDTVWLVSDSVGVYNYNVTITPADTVRDTLVLRATDLDKNSWYMGTHYMNKQDILREGEMDYNFLHHVKEQCDTRYLVHVQHKIDTIIIVTDTTICKGKSLTVDGTKYAEDAQINYEKWRDDDTWTKVDMKIFFSEPEIEYVTLKLTAEEVANVYRYHYNPKKYSDNIRITTFGEQEPVTYTPAGDCTHILVLTVEEKENSTITDVETVSTTEKRQLVMKDGMIYIEHGNDKYTILGNRL